MSNSGLRSRWSRWASIEEDAGTATISSRGWGTVVSWVIDADLFRALRALKTAKTTTKRSVERDADPGAVCTYITAWLSWVVDTCGAIRTGGKAAAAADSSCGPGSYSGCRALFDADAGAVNCDIAAWLAGVIDTDGAVRARRKAAAAAYSCSRCRCHTGCAAGRLRAILYWTVSFRVSKDWRGKKIGEAPPGVGEDHRISCSIPVRQSWGIHTAWEELVGWQRAQRKNEAYAQQAQLQDTWPAGIRNLLQRQWAAPQVGEIGASWWVSGWKKKCVK